MPDETDKPRDSFEHPSLEEHLHEELRETILRSKQPIEVEWSTEDQAELNSELARVTFDPSHANPDFPDRTVVIEDMEVQIHAYNSFPRILSAVDFIRHAKGTRHPTPVESSYAALAEERRYLEVFAALEVAFPALYKRSKQIFNSGEQAELPGRSLNADERAFMLSQAYSAAAHQARTIDPNYNLDFLRK